jgi:hypothetical protein
MKKLLLTLALLTLSITTQAAVYEVKARNNATTGGVGLTVAAFNVGDLFTVTVNPLDLWSAGQDPRWSNANGLTGPNLLSTGLADVTGDRPTNARGAGTLIGTSFGNWSQGGLTAPYGALVGEWGNSVGQYFLIGTQYVGVAADSQLKLFYFDSNRLDNKGSVLVNVSVTAVPEPETYILMLVGLSLVGFSARRRKV